MPFRAYVISNKLGSRTAMRFEKTFPTASQAVAYAKKKNKGWMGLNYNKEWVKKANFEYGAVEVKAGKFAFPKGDKGNKELLRWHNKQQKKKNTINFFDY